MPNVRRAIDKLISMGYEGYGPYFVAYTLIKAESHIKNGRNVYLRGKDGAMFFGFMGNGRDTSDCTELKLSVRSKRKNFKEWCKDVG